MQDDGDAVTADVIAERAPIGLLVLDENGTITWANEEYAELIDVAREDLVGTPFTDLVDAGYYEDAVIDQWTATVRVLLSSSNDRERESYLVRTQLDDDTLVHDVATALLPLDEDGAFQGTVHAFRDITAQKTSERELRRQNERLDDFASVVSHDLRNPLAIAQGFLERARETHDQDAFDRVERAHRDMQTLIEDLLSLARSGERVQDTSNIPLATAARQAWASVDTGDATLDVDDGLGDVNADETRLRQLLENLFRNCVEHGSTNSRQSTENSVEHNSTDSTGSLTVHLGPLEDAQGFFVEDDGVGIPPERADRVFDRGYTTASRGTGLGLAIVQTIADAHGWHIELGDADGARFEVRTDDQPPL